MKICNIVIIICQLSAVRSFSVPRKYGAKKSAVPSTQLFYTNDDAPISVFQDLDINQGIAQQENSKKISYEDIQDLIDVSRPYYNLKDEAIVTDPTTGTLSGFSATVTPEMPLAYESGTMTISEAGRHMAIAGSVASALSKEASGVGGKHYYLALDARIRQQPMSTNIRDYFEKMCVESKDGDATVFARSIETNKRDATAEVYLLANDDTIWCATITYKIIPYKLFDRFFPRVVDPSLTGPWDPTTANPYEKVTNTFITPQPLAHWKDPTVYHCSSHIPAIHPSMCAGHFDKNPCVPVAFLCSLLVNIGAESVAELAGVSLPYTRRNKNGNKDKIRARNTVTIKDVELDAKTLCMAGTHGLNVQCETKFIPNNNEGQPVYETVLKVTSDCNKKNDIVTLKLSYVLNEVQY